MNYINTSLLVFSVISGGYFLLLSYLGKLGQEVELPYKHPLGIRAKEVLENEKNWRIAHFSVHAVYYAQGFINIIAALGAMGVTLFTTNTLLITGSIVGIWLLLNTTFIGLRYSLAKKSIAEYI